MGHWGRRFVAVLAAATATSTVMMLTPALVSAVGSATRGYVLERTGTLAVFDAVTNTVAERIVLGGGDGLRVRPDGAEVYVADGDGAIHVLNTATNTVVATIAVGGQPRRVAFTPDSRQAYTANTGLGAVQVIDTASHRISRVIPIDPVGMSLGLWGLAVSPDGTKVYLGREYLTDVAVVHDIVVIRTATNTVTKVIPLATGRQPQRVVFSPNGRLAMTDDGNILDVTTDSLLRRFPIGTSWARNFAFTADSGSVLVSDTCVNNNQGALRQFDVTTGTLLRSLLAGRLPMSLSLTPDRNHLYIVVDGGNNIAVVNVSAWTVEDEFGLSAPATPTRMLDLDVSGTAPAARPGTRFGLARPFSACRVI